jgi:hypothetical protein
VDRVKGIVARRRCHENPVKNGRSNRTPWSSLKKTEKKFDRENCPLYCKHAYCNNTYLEAIAMQLQCKIAVKAAKIWPYYADPAMRSIWEEDLESLVFDGEVKTGTTGRMKLKDMPGMRFTLTEVIEGASWCDRTDVPGMGSLFFDHQILREEGQTYIQHSVRLEKDRFGEEDLGFLNGVFADVPGAVLKIKREVEK